MVYLLLFVKPMFIKKQESSNQIYTAVFVEQTLVSPGSKKNSLATCPIIIPLCYVESTGCWPGGVVLTSPQCWNMPGEEEEKQGSVPSQALFALCAEDDTQASWCFVANYVVRLVRDIVSICLTLNMSHVRPLHVK